MEALQAAQGRLDELRRQHSAAATAAATAEATVKELTRQRNDLQRQSDVNGANVDAALTVLQDRRDEAARQMATATKEARELAARITAFESELPALEKAERRQRLDALIGDLRLLVSAYTDAAREFLRLHAMYAQGYAQASRLAAADQDSPSIGVSPIGEMEMVESMRRAQVLQSADLPGRLTK